MKKPGSCDVPLPVRAVIIAFRSLLGCRWTQISALLDISEDTARKLYQRTEALAGALDTNTQYPILETALFYHLLPHIEPLNEARAHPSQLRRVEPGSEESISLRNDVLKHRTWNRTIAANHERKRKALAPLDGNTIRRVCLDQVHSKLDPVHPKPIKRRRRPRKTALNNDDRAQRLQYTYDLEEVVGITIKQAEAQQWQVEEKVIIIGVDEYMLTFGGSGNENISALEGEDIYKFAQNVQEKRFKLMQWGAASATLADPTYPYPHSIWEAESPELKKELAHKLEQQVKKLRLAMDRQRENALIPGTIEHAHLARLNAEIDTHNKQLPHRQRIGRRKKMTPARAFVYEEYSRDLSKGGLDFVWYAFEVYEKLLFPYYQRLREEYPGHRILISEDSATPHIKARKLLRAEIDMDGIEFINWPPNSPDLHPIEDVQKHHKVLLEDLCFSVKSAAKSTKNECKEEMRRIWQEDPVFRAIVLEVMSVGNYLRLAGLCRAHKGDNNFKA